MNDLLESKKDELHNIEELKDISENPVIKTAASLINLFPGAGAFITSTVSGGLKMFENKKREEIEKIIFDDGTITLDDVKDVRFIMEYIRLMEVVDRLSENKKVKYMGRLFKNAVLSNEDNKYDIFDERLHKFDQLSNREIEVMYYLYESQYNIEREPFGTYGEETPDDKRLRIWKTFLEFAKKHGYHKKLAEEIIAGTTRTGFCKIQYLNVTDKTKVIYLLTGEYFKFVKQIGLNE
nr:MAG TPA: hypothetical protein [Caudoviricetes sp.]